MTEDQAKAYNRLLYAIFGEKYDESLDVPASDALIETLDRVLGTINSNEDKLIRNRFGIADGEAKSIAELAVILEMTEDRVRQVESEAISKLRHPARSDQLREFLD